MDAKELRECTQAEGLFSKATQTHRTLQSKAVFPQGCIHSVEQDSIN